MNPIHIYRTILSAAGEQAPVLKRCLRDSVIAASLQGASFALLVPICQALGAGNNRAAVLWLLAALMVACIRFAEPLGQILSMSSIYSMVQQGYARLQELLAVAPLERVGEAAAAKPPSSASSCATPTRSRGASSSAAPTSAPSPKKT